VLTVKGFQRGFLSLTWDFHCKIVSVFNVVPPKGPKTIASQYWLSSSSLEWGDFSEFSEFFNGTIYHRRRKLQISGYFTVNPFPSSPLKNSTSLTSSFYVLFFS